LIINAPSSSAYIQTGGNTTVHGTLVTSNSAQFTMSGGSFSAAATRNNASGFNAPARSFKRAATPSSAPYRASAEFPSAPVPAPPLT
jgi:hypothetical protein